MTIRFVAFNIIIQLTIGPCGPVSPRGPGVPGAPYRSEGKNRFEWGVQAICLLWLDIGLIQKKNSMLHKADDEHHVLDIRYHQNMLILEQIINTYIWIID